jgi:hypothetical protein
VHTTNLGFLSTGMAPSTTPKEIFYYIDPRYYLEKNTGL